MLDKRARKRSHPKRHSVNREKSFEARRKARLEKLNAKKRGKEIEQHKREVAAYWRGERKTHPNSL